MSIEYSIIISILIFLISSFDEALEYYEGILKDDPTNTIISKRIVAIHKARGDMALAITKLTEILGM